MDVKTAFLSEKQTEDVFMAQPEGFENEKHLKEYARFKRPFMDLNRLLIDGIFASMRKLHSLDFLEANMRNDIPTLQSVKDLLGKCFTMKDLGNAAYILVADSTRESEYYEASTEAIWMKNFIGDLRVVPTVQDPIEIFYDNESAVALTKEPKDHEKSIRSEDNPADPFTKALDKSQHDEHAKSIGLKYNIKF
nr:hypothetical protein [Tanacetum cinerariifolium]